MEYRKLDGSKIVQDVLLGGQYQGVVTYTDSTNSKAKDSAYGYAIIALNNWREDALATEMATDSMAESDVAGDDAVAGFLHHENMGALDPRQLIVGDQIGVRAIEFGDDGLVLELSEVIDSTRNQIADETGPGYGKTPAWEEEDEEVEDELEHFVCDVCGKDDFENELGVKVHKGMVHQDEEEPDEPTTDFGEPTPGSLREVYGDGGATVDDYADVGPLEPEQPTESAVGPTEPDIPLSDNLLEPFFLDALLYAMGDPKQELVSLLRKLDKGEREDVTDRLLERGADHNLILEYRDVARQLD